MHRTTQRQKSPAERESHCDLPRGKIIMMKNKTKDNIYKSKMYRGRYKKEIRGGIGRKRRRRKRSD